MSSSNQFNYQSINQSPVNHSPTPRVDWTRLGSPLPGRARKESFGMELVIDNVQFEDAGNYECNGINEQSPTPIRRSVTLGVQG